MHLFVGNFGEFDVAGGADKLAGTTGYTCFRVGLKWCRHLHFSTTARKVYCIGTYPLAHPHAQSAKDAVVVVQLEPRGVDLELLRQVLDVVVVRAAGPEQLNEHLPVTDDLLGVSGDLHARPNRVVA